MRTLPPRLSLLAVLVLAAAILAVPAQADAKRLPPGFWGVQTVTDASTADAASIAASGAEVVRVQFRWRGIEPSPPNALGARSYDWSRTDAVMARLAAAGLGAFGTVTGSPGWLTPSVAHTPANSPEGRQGWHAFVGAIARRYGPGGAFWAENPLLPQIPLRAYEVWNEQNSAARYKPQPDPASYSVLVSLASDAVRSVDPGAKVVLGGMFGTPNNLDKQTGSMNAWVFLQQVYDALGSGQAFDAVGVHPYSPDLRGIKYQMNKIRKVMDRNGDRGKPIEVTEIGWSSLNSEKFYLFLGHKGQAKMLKSAFQLLVEKRRRWKLKRIIWFAWKDEGRVPGCGYCQKFGLVREDGRKKMAYSRYRAFTKGKLPR